MIYTTKEQLARYKGISADLDTAIDFILTHDLDQLQEGTNVIDGDNVFVNRFGYTTQPQADAFFEGHIAYLDIHMVLDGEEQIGVSDVKYLTKTGEKEGEDFVTYDGPVQNWAVLRPGDALVVFPEDAHMVKVQLNGPSQVKKAVFKVKV